MSCFTCLWSSVPVLPAMTEKLVQCYPKFDSLHVGVKCSAKLCVPICNVRFPTVLAGLGVGVVIVVWIVWKHTRRRSNNFRKPDDVIHLLESLKIEMNEIGRKVTRMEGVIRHLGERDRGTISNSEAREIFIAQFGGGITKEAVFAGMFAGGVEVLLAEKRLTLALELDKHYCDSHDTYHYFLHLVLKRFC